MKKILLIPLILLSVSCFSQRTWVIRRGDLWLINGNDSTNYGAEDLLRSMPWAAEVIRARTSFAGVTGSNATTTGQSLTDVTGLTRPLVANAVYEIEAVMSVSTSAVTTGVAYGVNYSAAGATIEAHIMGSSTATATKTLRISAFNTPTTLFLATSNQSGGVVIKGTVITGANEGILSIQHLKLTSGTSTVFTGSFLKVTRIQ